MTARWAWLGFVCLLFEAAAVPAFAQARDEGAPAGVQTPSPQSTAPQSTAPQSTAPQQMAASSLIEAIEQHGSSGTSAEPPSTPVPMIMRQRGAWTLMLHGNAFAVDTQQQAQSGRGRDAFFSTNWIMPMAQHPLGARGLLTLRTMLSAEPATMRGREYPELFQQGETAFGAPIVDAQHPHDFLMEIAALYDVKLGARALLSLYAAPVGDPAIGPTAYPHRLSASEDPIAALGHHQQDSTHIAFNVLTGGLTWGWARVELSGFHGAEPTEAHWHPEPSPNGHALDSVATRVTVAPAADWSAQYSIAHIASPEALYPGEDQQRQTASLIFHHSFSPPAAAQDAGSMQGMNGMSGMSGMDDMPGMDMSPGTAETRKMIPPARDASHHATGHGMMRMRPEPRTDFSATLLWGRTRSLTDGTRENSYLAEGLLRFARSNYAWTRLENAARSSELLLSPGTALPARFSEHPIGHVAAFTFGYDRDFALGRHVLAAPGAQFTVYRAPAALVSSYGAHPAAEQVFVRLRLR